MSRTGQQIGFQNGPVKAGPAMRTRVCDHRLQVAEPDDGEGPPGLVRQKSDGSRRG